jgi:hypothetical protein
MCNNHIAAVCQHSSWLHLVLVIHWRVRALFPEPETRDLLDLGALQDHLFQVCNRRGESDESWPYKPAAIVGSLTAIATFTVTLSFIFTAPGWEASLGGFPAISVVPGQFLLKDLVLLAAAISLLGKALSRQE